MNCLDYAYHYISRYPKTVKELKVQLMKKGYKIVEIEYAIKSLEKAGYVSDEMFTKLYINSELINKGKPVIAIRQKLYEKGVDKSIVTKVMSDLQEEIYEGISVKILKLIEEFKKKGIVGAFLISKVMSRGYSLEQIKKVLKNREENLEISE